MPNIPTTSGVYCILNEITGKLYIGSAINLRERRRQHFRLLKEGIHPNTHLQNSVNHYGLSAFYFYIIELCNKEELIQLEQNYMDETECYNMNNGYNLCPVAGSRLNSKASAETKAEMSKRRRGKNNNFYGKQHNDKTRAKISRAKKGKKLSDETRAKMSASRKGKSCPANSRPGKRNPMYGKKHSAKIKKQLSELKKKEWREYYAERDSRQLLLFG